MVTGAGRGCFSPSLGDPPVSKTWWLDVQACTCSATSGQELSSALAAVPLFHTVEVLVTCPPSPLSSSGAPLSKNYRGCFLPSPHLPITWLPCRVGCTPSGVLSPIIQGERSPLSLCKWGCLTCFGLPSQALDLLVMTQGALSRCFSLQGGP